MTTSPGALLASSSVAIIVLVTVTATAIAPDDMRWMLFLCAVWAVLAAAQAAARDPAALRWAILVSLPPVVALVADESPTWLVGPLGALLLVAAELNAVSWRLRGKDSPDDLRRRLLNIAQLGALGIAGSLAVWLMSSVPTPGGMAALFVGVAALAGLASVTFGRGA